MASMRALPCPALPGILPKAFLGQYDTMARERKACYLNPELGLALFSSRSEGTVKGSSIALTTSVGVWTSGANNT